jgi:hypothetical protein
MGWPVNEGLVGLLSLCSRTSSVCIGLDCSVRMHWMMMQNRAALLSAQPRKEDNEGGER